MKITDTHIYFYGSNDFLSNFYPCKIFDKYLLNIFDTAEQFFMFTKAETFLDEEIKLQILASKSPSEAKELGRKVKHFDANLWDIYSVMQMFGVLLFKFDNVVLKKQLLDTGNKILVEASPTDLIWGVGLSENDPLILDEKNWRGQNKLGKCLMTVRYNYRVNENK